MPCKKRTIVSGKQSTHILKATSLIFFVLSSCIFLSFFICDDVCADTSYVPAAPLGPIYGFPNITYSYSIITSNPDASWMFDWGDGNMSAWLRVGASEQSIVQTHLWNTPGTYRVRAKYRSSTVGEAWSTILSVLIVAPEETDIPYTPEPPSGKSTQTVNRSCSYVVVSSDEKGDMLQYRMDWDDGSVSGWSSLVDSGTPVILSHMWTHMGVYSIRAQVRDVWGLTSAWSNYSNVTIEIDSDGDRLSDYTETRLGSNFFDPSDVQTVMIHAIEYFVVTTNAGNRVLFYNDSSETSTLMELNSDGTYVIDENNDGSWDYFYYAVSGSVAPYVYVPQSFSFSLPEIPLFLVVIIVIVVVVLVILFVLYKKGFIYVYEEYIVEE